MKSRIILFIIFIIGVAGVITVLQKQEPSTTTIEGTVAEKVSTDNRLSIYHNGQSETIALAEDVVVETPEKRVQPSYLRVGFPVEVDVRRQKGEPDMATWITVTEEPPVLVHTPLPGAALTAPTVVRGEARGPWYFEGSFQVDLRNESGETIASAVAQAQDDWMQEGYVPFEAELDFSGAGSVGDRGTLVLEKANPSGLPENAASTTVPVRFPETMRVSVYFGKDIVGTDIIECDAVFEVERMIPQTQAVARAALNELLKGPTPREIQERYVTNIPEGVEIQRLEISNGTARVDFNQALQQDVGGSCRVQAIRTQIEETLTQFETVDDVVISVDGETETVLQP